MKPPKTACWLTALLLTSLAHAAELPSAAEVLEETGVSAGLAVVVGTTDGKLEADLARTERFVVHGLALDDARRDRGRATIQNSGLYGLASVETWRGAAELPYGDRLVNLIVADADALLPKAMPAETEWRRVLAPSGVIYVRRDGKWTRTVQPRPAEMDDWTHEMHGPESNEVSHDTLVGPQTALKWINWYEKQSLSHQGEFRSADGLVFHHEMFVGKEGKNRPVCFLVARDAFNGVVRWRMPLDFHVRAQAMVAHNRKLFTLLTPQETGKPLTYVALDAQTGKLLKSYDQLNLGVYDPGAARSGLLNDWRAYKALHVEDRFYWFGGKQVVGVDEAGGNVLWRVETDKPVAFPAFDKATGRLFVVLAGNQGRWTRWPGLTAEAVLCLDAKTGRELWRCAEACDRGIGQLTVDGDRLMFFNGCMNLSYHPDKPDSVDFQSNASAILGTIRIADGKLLWARKFIVEDKLAFDTHRHWVSNAAARDGLYWAMGKNCLFAYDRDGRLVHSIRPDTPNSRCVRGRATDRFFLFGFGGFFGEEGWTFQNVSRGSCAVGMTPANGMTYQIPGVCHCFASVRGYAGFASDPPPQVADATRLQEGGPAEPVYARTTPAPPEPEIVPAKGPKLPYRNLTISPQPLRDEWVNNDLPVFWETKSVRAGDLDLVVVAHEHRLEARRGDKVVWSFTADGRITAPPLVHGDAVFVASHDGFLCALDAATGKRLWRFLAGSPRRMLAYGQLESAQPVTNAVLYEGAVCCAAGRHPEIDGGILVWALEPKTGAVRWKVAIQRDLTWAKQPREKTFARYQNVVLNRGLLVEDGQLKLVSDPPYYGPLVIDPTKPPSGPAFRPPG